jgi:hypothetical protein
MDQETDDRLMELMRAVLFIAKKRIGQRDFTPYGVCLAIDGTIAWQGVEGSHTVEDLMTLFKGLAPKAEAFAIVTMVPSGGPDGECLFFNIVEHCSGTCAFSCATVRDVPGNDLAFENEAYVPATPELFVSHH